jgi:hypothetical protein
MVLRRDRLSALDQSHFEGHSPNRAPAGTRLGKLGWGTGESVGVQSNVDVYANFGAPDEPAPESQSPAMTTRALRHRSHLLHNSRQKWVVFSGAHKEKHG